MTVSSRTRIFTKTVTAQPSNFRAAIRLPRNFFPNVESRSTFFCPDNISAGGSRTIVPGLGTIVPELGFANSFQQCNSLKSLTDFQFRKLEARMPLCAPGKKDDMVQKNRNAITEKFGTASYDSQGVPKSIHTAQKLDQIVREPAQVIQKGERPVQLDGSVTRKCRHVAP